MRKQVIKGIYGFNKTKQRQGIENRKDKEIAGCQQSGRPGINQSKQVQDDGGVWSDVSEENTKQIDCSRY